MLVFKQITLADRKIINQCLQYNTYRACDFSFTNMLAWSAKFEPVYSVVNNTLFIRFKDDSGQVFYMLPNGKLPLRQAILYLYDDAKSNGIPFQMKGVTERMWKEIQAEFPTSFRYEKERNNAEYLYFSEKLIHLKGRKLQSKRNHINRFKADNPHWEYVPVTSKNDCMACLQMLNLWEEIKTESAKEISLGYDYIATKLMLELFDELELKGGMIRVNGKIVAFTIGEPLTNDTFVIHVEKAYGGINGAYTIINQQFVEHEASGFLYINREEDMGIESLRKAKMSYYPDLLLEEGLVHLVNDTISD